MPLHEYLCRECGQRSTILFRTFRAAELANQSPEQVHCPHCSSHRLERLISKPAILSSGQERLEALENANLSGALESEDPRAMAGLLRQVGAALNEPINDEMAEIVNRLEAGESPAAVGASLPEAPAPSGPPASPQPSSTD